MAVGFEVWQDKVYESECCCVPHTRSYVTAAQDQPCSSCHRGACFNDTGDEGWWYWYCQPGCLPDSDAFGPFPTYKAAHEAATKEL